MSTPTVFSQAALYDERYASGAYDRRANVRILTAEWKTLQRALSRVLDADPDIESMFLLDFGYGSGRVTNRLAMRPGPALTDRRIRLTIIAYDVSAQGLMRGWEELVEAGFSDLPHQEFMARADAKESYVAGVVERGDVRVVFAHGDERGDAATMRAFLQAEVLHGERCLVTTSWYSGLGHIPGQAPRQAFFDALADLTSDRGELLVAVSSAGDLVDAQAEYADLLRRQKTGGLPIEVPGDVIYETELGQSNYWHVFAADFAGHLRQTCASRRRAWWIEAVRFPGDEFRSRRAEKRNYLRVLWFNAVKRRRGAMDQWSPEDYVRLHTIVGVVSGATPTAQAEADTRGNSRSSTTDVLSS